MIEFKEYEESLTSEVGPNLTPLIDMMFLLLIFFLLTSFLVRPSIPVELPEAETTAIAEETEITVTLFSDGRVLLNGRAVTLENLEARLRRMHLMRRTEELVIQADKMVRFEMVVEIMDISHKSGMKNISFLVERE